MNKKIVSTLLNSKASLYARVLNAYYFSVLEPDSKEAATVVEKLSEETGEETYLRNIVQHSALEDQKVYTQGSTLYYPLQKLLCRDALKKDEWLSNNIKKGNTLETLLEAEPAKTTKLLLLKKKNIAGLCFGAERFVYIATILGAAGIAGRIVPQVWMYAIGTVIGAVVAQQILHHYTSTFRGTSFDYFTSREEKQEWPARARYLDGLIERCVKKK